MDISFTDRELDVMAVLWRRGSGTVTEVRDDLDDDLAYTTVLTILRTLEDKGFVTHLSEGKAHRYLPAVTQDLAGKSALSRVLDKIFDGSSEMLLTQLVSDRSLDAAELKRLRELLDKRLETPTDARAARKKGKS
jgi:BlaI family penicillinase repressor